MTTKELLEAVGKPADFKTPEKKNYVAEFIIDTSMISGNVAIPNYIIFYMYMTQWRPRSEKKTSKIGFFREFNKHFTPKRNKNNRQYLLDGAAFTNIREFDEEAKTFNKRYDKKRTKKAKHEREAKVSCSSKEV